MMTKFAWWALALSILLHLASVLAEPLANWLAYRQIDDPVLKKTDRKLQAQSLEDFDKPAELAGVKPVEQQYVLLQKPQPIIAAAAPASPKPARKIASKVPAITPAVAKAGAVAASSVTTVASAAASAGGTVASAVDSAVQKVASEASSVSVATVAVASRSSKASSVSLATKIDRAAAKRFPRDVKIEYLLMGAPAYLHWQLEQGRYELRLDVPIPFNARRFISRGKIDRHGVMPENFIEYRKQFETPRFDVRFDWDKEEVTLIDGANQKIEPFAAGDQDLMSAALHLALMGGSQPKYDMALFSGRKRYPEVKFELKGEAMLKIGGKDIPALLMSSRTGERQVDFWLAPDWHNLPVRMVINFGKDGSYDLSAYNITLDGQKVLEWVNPNTQTLPNRRP
jgi:hypothetical protein